MGSDVLAVFYSWASDEKVTQFLRWSAHKDIKTMASMYSLLASEYYAVK